MIAECCNDFTPIVHGEFEPITYNRRKQTISPISTKACCLFKILIFTPKCHPTFSNHWISCHKCWRPAIWPQPVHNVPTRGRWGAAPPFDKVTWPSRKLTKGTDTCQVPARNCNCQHIKNYEMTYFIYLDVIVREWVPTVDIDSHIDVFGEI